MIDGAEDTHPGDQTSKKMAPIKSFDHHLVNIRVFPPFFKYKMALVAPQCLSWSNRFEFSDPCLKVSVKVFTRKHFTRRFFYPSKRLPIPRMYRSHRQSPVIPPRPLPRPPTPRPPRTPSSPLHGPQSPLRPRRPNPGPCPANTQAPTPQFQSHFAQLGGVAVFPSPADDLICCVHRFGECNEIYRMFYPPLNIEQENLVEFFSTDENMRTCPPSEVWFYPKYVVCPILGAYSWILGVHNRSSRMALVPTTILPSGVPGALHQYPFPSNPIPTPWSGSPVWTNKLSPK